MTPGSRVKISWIARISSVLALSTVTLAVLSLVAVARYGSIRIGLLATTGQQLVSEETEQSVGKLGVGERRVVPFHLRNLTARPITIVGAQANCTCTSAERLPMVVPAGGRLPLHVTYHAQRPTEVSEAVRLFTDSERNKQIIVRVTGHVTGGGSADPPRGGESRTDSDR